jgi:hemolysin III
LPQSEPETTTRRRTRPGKPNLIDPPSPHYPNEAERDADRLIHVLGLGAALAGGPILVAIAALQGGLNRAAAVFVYVLCLLAMLAISALYNLAKDAARRQRLRRLDHAAIFLMIAGSYTPFTTQRFDGAWAIGMTAAVWAFSVLAAAGKFFLPGLSKRLWILAYVLLGWMVVLAIEPLLAGVRPLALVLLVVGGVIYTVGALIYASHRLSFRRAIWHAFVLAAASVHYAAILIGVALA